MRKTAYSIIGITFMLLLASASLAQERGTVRQDATKSPIPSSGGRLALLIGNSTYADGGSLKNPVNDVRDMKAALESVGFRVMKHENCNQRSMKQAIDEFGEALRGYEVGLFFYAGHGVQVGGENYLIPVDANLQSEKVVEYDCVRADRVLAMMEGAGSKTNIVILDACRDNPFERSWRRGSVGRGLAVMNAPSGALIGYATAPGRTALDGTGRNGVYTSALLEHIRTSGISVLQMFQRVRVSVEERTNRAQTPWESTSLRGDFYFLGASTPIARVDAPRPSAGADPLAEERSRLEKERQGLEEERRKLEAERGKPQQAPALSGSQEVGRDGAYIAYANGIVKDTRTGLEWVAGPDEPMTREAARAWAGSLNVGGGGWRLPTIAELKGLYQYGKGKSNMTPLLKTTGSWVWSSEGQEQVAHSSPSLARFFNFDMGREDNIYLWRGATAFFRAFAVRSRSRG